VAVVQSSIQTERKIETRRTTKITGTNKNELNKRPFPFHPALWDMFKEVDGTEIK
jgi:hypothetical protein